ncbi:ligand-binding protein SH3 [Phytopseudomonas punonensis]|uniref:Variant SH3 domain-containing protein n=1 Tax=Phytopseudomonas punonensis TaxID=1220495 RepID=A0A1M7F295_9GAMM|nr:ligand-binding protein SH3 [Pseudomonas punonensis]SHL98184.1 hypothetical protein SAMN05216288_2738 [Pseudomonas punonensis]
MNPTPYLVVTAHRSEYPDPISFEAGALLQLGERYEGPEDWQDWYFCRTDAHPGGWMPLTILKPLGAGSARALEGYTARELDTEVNEQLIASRRLNGWLWCRRESSGETGWVPEQTLAAPVD